MKWAFLISVWPLVGSEWFQDGLWSMWKQALLVRLSDLQTKWEKKNTRVGRGKLCRSNLEGVLGRWVSLVVWMKVAPIVSYILGLVSKWLTVLEAIRRLTILENVSHWIWGLWLQQAHARSMCIAFCLLLRESGHKTASFCFSTIFSSLWLYTSPRW